MTIEVLNALVDEGLSKVLFFSGDLQAAGRTMGASMRSDRKAKKT